MIFCAIGSTQGGIWNTWGPITDAAKFAFDWNNGTIALLANWGPISYVLFAFGLLWLLDSRGKFDLTKGQLSTILNCTGS